jgi:predicted metal-dependent hydrolase
MTLRRNPPRAVRRDQVLATLELEGEPIDCLIKRSSARRSLSLRVNAQGVAQLNAPWGISWARIDAFLQQHSDWLKDQLGRYHAKPVWADGLTLPFLGGEISLEWRPTPHRRAAWQEGNRLVCEVSASHLETAVITWYRAEAERCLAARMSGVCARLEWPVPTWRLSNARTRWGSLSAQGVVSLNWRLVKAGRDEIDYVICHELAHIRRRDHSPAFWREVASLCPDYQALRQRLRLNAARYLSF